MTLSKVLRATGVDATVHGFRSTFRTWAAENINMPVAVLEMCLAHGIADKTQAAYDRATYLDKRRGIMQRWSDFLTRE
jgi:integrase